MLTAGGPRSHLCFFSLLLEQISYCDRIRPVLVLFPVLFPFRLTRLLRCIIFLLAGWIRCVISQLCGKGSKLFVKLYYFVHRNILPVCIFSLWTRASLNFGELNLYSAPQLKKVTSLRGENAEGDTHQFLFCFLSQGFFLFLCLFKQGLCLSLLSFFYVLVTNFKLFLALTLVIQKIYPFVLPKWYFGLN